ncbi:MAG: RNA methyltransferase [Lachnospiraceae bacterium]|nr:RNA methyltransferase [Lachnospiraceae bacterium]
MKKIYVDSIETPELRLYAERSEVQLLRAKEPAPGLFVAESLKVIERALNAGYEPLSFLVEPKLAEGEAKPVLERFPELPVYIAEISQIKGIIGYSMMRGILSLINRKELPKPESLCEKAKRIAVLENIVNPTNVGAIFRSAAALGMDAVFLSPGCADPLYRRAARVSMGTVFQIPWTFFSGRRGNWPLKCLEELRSMGFTLAGMALGPGTVTIQLLAKGSLIKPM